MRRSLKRFSPANLLLESPGIYVYIYIYTRLCSLYAKFRERGQKVPTVSPLVLPPIHPSPFLPLPFHSLQGHKFVNKERSRRAQCEKRGLTRGGGGEKRLYDFFGREGRREGTCCRHTTLQGDPLTAEQRERPLEEGKKGEERVDKSLGIYHRPL